ncbi:MAG: hypothetical protein U1F43_05480 [Myxococcota bacterium]
MADAEVDARLLGRWLVSDLAEGAWALVTVEADRAAVRELGRGVGQTFELEACAHDGAALVVRVRGERGAGELLVALDGDARAYGWEPGGRAMTARRIVEVPAELQGAFVLGAATRGRAPLEVEIGADQITFTKRGHAESFELFALAAPHAPDLALRRASGECRVVLLRPLGAGRWLFHDGDELYVLARPGQAPSWLATAPVTAPAASEPG